MSRLVARLLTGAIAVLALSGCVTIILPPEEQPSPTDLQLRLPDREHETTEAALGGIGNFA